MEHERGSASMRDGSYVYFDVRDSDKFFKQEKFQSWEIKPSFNLVRENGNLLLGRELSYYGRGQNSTVWKWECDGTKYAVKIFFDIAFSCALQKDTYKVMKNLPLKNTLKALDTLKVVNSSGDVVNEYGAYLMEFLEERKGYSIVEMSTPKLIENAKFLELDAKLLAQNRIVMQDVKKENTIFNKEDSMLYLSDIDMFYVSYDELSNGVLSDIVRSNNIELRFAFYEFLARYSSEHYHAIYNDFLESFFFRDTTHGKAVADKLDYLFSSYDTPKQFFEENEKKFLKKYFLT